MRSEESGRSPDAPSWPRPEAPSNRYRRHHYSQVLIRRRDLPRLRELVYRWKVSRLDVIARLLDLTLDGSRTKLVTAPPPVWDRLDDLAASTGLSRDELVAHALELVSWMSSAQVDAIMAPDPEQAP